VCGCFILPIKSKIRGPAPQFTGDSDDIIDETLYFLRPNLLFRTFPLDGSADRLLVYLTMFATRILGRIATCTARPDAEKAAREIAMETFLLPGDGGFVLGGMLAPPKDATERELIRTYLGQLRQELAERLVAKCFADGVPNKWWLSFSKRKFLNMTMTK
jgi:actin related protein 2/3 complex subunit 3